MFSLKLIVFSLFWSYCWINTHALECQYKGYDFSPLDGQPWVIKTVNGSAHTTYRLSVCKALTAAEEPCQHQTAVCRQDGNTNFTPIGNFTSSLNITEDTDKAELWMRMKGAPCTDMPGHFTTTIINFKCGKTLGSPRLLDRYACDTYFEWHTSVACRSPPTISEVKCHVYDSDGFKRDLTPLIRQRGGTLVDSAGERDFYINVCREITPNGTSQQCPDGAAACELRSGGARDLGKPVGSLSITGDNKLYLLYQSDQTQPGCDSPPTTSITFICPSRGGTRGKVEVLKDKNKPMGPNQIKQDIGVEDALSDKVILVTLWNCAALHDISEGLRVSVLNSKLVYNDFEKVRTVYVDYSDNIIGREPLLTSDLGCHYDIEWVTEYACPEQRLVSHTCKLTQSQHDIEFDLNPLHKAPGSEDPYKITVTEGTRTYDYYLNVCGELNIPCPSDIAGISACQVNGNFAKVLGRHDHQTLRYSDGELTLTYQAGDKCSSHFRREIVINFHCSPSAPADGMGWPVFNHEDNCTYLFDWDTKHACLPHALPAQCHVKHDDHRFDLSSLIREGRINWEALRSTHIAGDTDDDRYFLNICHEVLRVGVAAACPPGAAVCLRDKTGSYVNLGEYMSTPTYNAATGSLQLHYTNGSLCSGDKRHETSITLKCKPGDLESGPDLVLSSHDGCRHEFEWETAAACTLSTQRGTKCMVTDPDAGYSINLGQLQLSGDSAFYNLTSPDGQYTFYINVCGATKGSPCDTAGKTDTAVCQVSTINPNQVVSAGKVSDALSYYNGLVNLTYTNGDPYHSDPPHPRSAEIAFLCAPDAGRGHPEFVHEANYTYSFRWLTSYVCPESPVECIVTDSTSGQQYDLSSLARAASAGNWVTSETGSTRKFYLNVCRPVNPLPGGVRCAPQSAACSTRTDSSQTEVVSVANLGQAKSGPTIEGEGRLLLTYDDGAACTMPDGTKTTYTTNIHLRCQKGQLNQAPRLLSTLDCIYVFLWETATACPLGGEVPSGPTPSGPSPTDGTGATMGDCSAKDPNSEFVYDLTALRKKDSEVGYAVGDFRLNICGPVRIAGCDRVAGQEAAVCNGTQHIAGVSSQLLISDNGRLSLHYQGPRMDNGKKKEVVVLFQCNKNAVEGPLRLTRSTVELIEITMETALACSPEPVDCVTTDSQGREYDLSPLSRSADNWQVMDPRMEYQHLSYYINVCHTLNKVTATANCPGGAIGGCQVGTDNAAHNIGYVQSKPVAGQNGALSIRYLGGDICHKGTPLESRRSTRIIFECADTQSAPVFQSETANCEYIFTWETPSACPLQSVAGAACQVTDPLYHYTFDLSHLRKVGDHDYAVNATQYTYLLNVCGPLNAGPGTCNEEVGACQTKAISRGGVTTTDAGKANQRLTYNDGELTLTYKDGKGPCHGKYNRSTVISFVCDHTTMGTQGPSFVNETSDCTYLFEWRTSMACTSFQVADCTIKDPQGQEYDLSPLTLTNDNYVYDRVHRSYFINVCTSLVRKKGVTCPPNSAACYYDSEEKKYVKLGETAARLLKFDANNNIELTYTNGQNCSGPGNRKHQTVITFVCKTDAIASSPTLVFAEDDCIFHFVWETRVACPITDSAPASNNCTVRNPVTGYSYNMAGLGKPEGYVTQDSRGHELLINICGPLANSRCKGNPGSCQTEVGGQGTWNAGMANGELHFIDGDLFLNYSNGDICHHNNLTRNTIINFVCAKKGTGNGTPVFVDEDDDCNYFVSWHTELACERQVRCEVEDDRGNVLDLSPLVRGSGAHLVMAGTYPDATYYINVCRPLNPISGALCPPQAAACRVKDGESPKSLGRVSQAPVFDEYSRNVYIVYDHGAPCDKNGGKSNATSRINFVCKPGPEMGQPILEMVTSDCMHMFEWETNVVCTSNESPKVTTNCQFKINRMEYTYDLSALSKKPGSTTGYQLPSGKGTYYINMCAPVVDAAAVRAGCAGAAVCLVDEQGHASSYGTPDTQQYVMEGNTLKVSYTGGKTCGSGKAASFFLFECNQDVKGLSRPEIFSTSIDGCEVVFKWQTALACRPITTQCSLAHKDAVYNLDLLSSQTGFWTVKDGHGNTFWLNVCQGLHGVVNSSDCPSNAAVCRRDAQGKVDTLGLIQTQRISMADDEKTIIVEFSQGSNTCAQRRRRRSSDQASVRIYMQCASTLDDPVFVPRKGDKDSCAFEFNWRSPAACKETRVQASEVNGMLVDPRSGGMIDLSKFRSNEDYHVKSEDQKLEFFINVQQAVSVSAVPCYGSAVCQRVVGSSSGTGVGDLNTRKFYISDGVVEAVFTSNTSCQSDITHKASTIIYFHCIDTLKNDTKPVFRTKTRSCIYLFDWYTPDICVQPMIHAPSGKIPSSTDNSVIAAHASTAGVVVGVIIALTILVILIAIFSKADRRQTFRRGVRRVFQRRHGGSLIKYSTLSSLEEDESLIPDNTANGSATLSDLPTGLPTFDDESDEDLII